MQNKIVCIYLHTTDLDFQKDKILFVDILPSMLSGHSVFCLRNNHRVGGLGSIRPRPRSGEGHKDLGQALSLCGLPLTEVLV